MASAAAALIPLADTLLHLLSSQRINDTVISEADDETHDVSRDGDL
jgi:hypothetical protein